MTSLVNPTYTVTTLAKVEILDNHVCFMYLWNFNQRFLNYTSVLTNIVVVILLVKCYMKPLSKLLTSILPGVKNGHQSYCDSSYSWGGVNQIWILKNSKGLSPPAIA